MICFECKQRKHACYKHVHLSFFNEEDGEQYEYKFCRDCIKKLFGDLLENYNQKYESLASCNLCVEKESVKGNLNIIFAYAKKYNNKTFGMKYYWFHTQCFINSVGKDYFYKLFPKVDIDGNK